MPLSRRSTLLLLLLGLTVGAGVRGASALPARLPIAVEDNPLVRSAANPLLSRGPEEFDKIKIGPRAILREAPNVWKMWYEGVPAANASKVGYATSTDGISWTKYAGNPIMAPTEPWEGAPAAASETSPSSVLKEHGLYKMWYHGYQNGTRRIGYATSLDGFSWTKYPRNPVLEPGPAGAWDADSISGPHVLSVQSTYFLYYQHATGDHAIGLATSSDGVNWRKYEGNPILTKGLSGSWDTNGVQVGRVVYDGALFHMWFRGISDSGSIALGYAWSVDGMHWMESPNNPLLAKPNPPLGKGDDFGVESNTNVIRRGPQWWIYYGGFVSCCPEDVGVNLAFSAVNASPNTAPTVDAGADQTITFPAAVQLNGTVMDDDTPVPLAQVQTTWSQLSGPGTASFANPNVPQTTATFSQPGSYTLRLTANDSQLSSAATLVVSVGEQTGTVTPNDATPEPTPTRNNTATPLRTATPVPTTPNGTLGDANCDGLLSVADILGVARLIATGERAPCGWDDANEDGSVTLEDIAVVLDRLFRLPVGLSATAVSPRSLS